MHGQELTENESTFQDIRQTYTEEGIQPKRRRGMNA